MIEEQAIVVKCDKKYIWVQTQRQSSCGHCSVKNGCGTQLLSKVVGNKTTYVRCLSPDLLVDNKVNETIRVGDHVLIGLQESALLNGSFLMYLLPLFSMILAAGLALFMAKNWWPAGSDLFALVGAILGLVSGFKLAQLFTRRSPDIVSSPETFNSAVAAQYEPVILKKLAHFVTIDTAKIQPIR